jgi:hypothetical protein
MTDPLTILAKRLYSSLISYSQLSSSPQAHDIPLSFSSGVIFVQDPPRNSPRLLISKRIERARRANNTITVDIAIIGKIDIVASNFNLFNFYNTLFKKNVQIIRNNFLLSAKTITMFKRIKNKEMFVFVLQTLYF